MKAWRNTIQVGASEVTLPIFQLIRTCFGVPAGCSWKCFHVLCRRCTSEGTASQDTFVCIDNAKCVTQATQTVDQPALMKTGWVRKIGRYSAICLNKNTSSHIYLVLLAGFANFNGQMSNHGNTGNPSQHHVAVFFGEYHHPANFEKGKTIVDKVLVIM